MSWHWDKFVCIPIIAVYGSAASAIHLDLTKRRKLRNTPNSYVQIELEICIFVRIFEYPSYLQPFSVSKDCFNSLSRDYQ